jgi:hypothetical protein
MANFSDDEELAIYPVKKSQHKFTLCPSVDALDMLSSAY